MSKQKSLIESLKDFFNSFEKPSSWYVELGAYIIIGFIIGFLVKHGGRFFFMLLLGAFLALWLFDYLQIVSINYPLLKSLVGLPAEMTFNDIVAVTTNWIKEHIVEFLVGFLGFIIAWKFA